MKHTCVICQKTKGKRICRVRGDAVVCSPCCASVRNQDCKDCQHYIFAQKYETSKYRPSEDSHSEPRHFLAEINEEVEESVNVALRYIESGRFQKGEKILQNLMEIHPHNHLVHYAMGTLYAVQGQHDKAIAYFDNDTDIFPYFVEAYFNKAVAYKEKVDIRNMVRTFQKVIEIGDPGTVYVHQAKQFLADFKKNILKHEGLTIEDYFKGMDHFEEGVKSMSQKNWEQAISSFKNRLLINENHPQSYGNMGICYAYLGQRKLALKSFDKALALDPKYELAVVNRAIVESFNEGEKLPNDVGIVEYYKEYPLKKKSYITSFLESLK